MGLAACSCCGYAYYRTCTWTAKRWDPRAQACSTTPPWSNLNSTAAWPSCASLNSTTAERARLERDHTRTTKAISRLVQAYQEDLLSP